MKFLEKQFSFSKVVFVAAFVLFVVHAYTNIGYFHADEHYQIIEFAGIKLGSHQSADLAWEYKEASRQTIQPAIAYVLFMGAGFFHVNDPYILAFLLRLLTALVALSAIAFFVKNVQPMVAPESGKTLIFLSFFLWFIPAVNVRFSSESWSGIFILFMLAMILGERKSNRYKHLVVGLFMGLAFLFRFQSAFLSLGVIAWLLTIKRIAFRDFIALTFGGAITLVFGFLVDSWFYGKLVFTPWTYFDKQILQGIAAGFGESEWWFYLWEILRAPTIPFGILIASSLIIIIFRRPKSILLWAILPFIIGHSFVAHKEVRFLLPLVNLVPLLLVTAFDEINALRMKHFASNTFETTLMFKGLAMILLAMNATALLVMATKPAGTGKMAITAYIAENYPGQQIHLLHTPWSSPYNPWESVPTKFYQIEGLTETRIRNLCQVSDSLLQNDKTNLLVTRMAELNVKNCSDPFLANSRTILLKQSIPDWILWLNKGYKGIYEDDVLFLYAVKEGGLHNQ
ncbi:MAG: hypothetical protein Q8J88_09210 [Bacteroidales bacterium]|nr:hypothetical protein [Bacteroidales bacterium]